MTLSQQIGRLNASGRLSDRLNFDEVIGPLSHLDEEAASQILRDLENSGSRVQKPTAYVLAAASRRGRDRSPRPGRQRLAGGDAGPRGGGDGLSRKIGWLNKNASLAERISFDDVAGPLSALRDDAAMKILDDLERNAAKVNNPTKYVLAAAARAGGGHDWPGHAAAEQANAVDPTGKIGRQVGWLNREVDLQQKISYSDVVERLSELDVSSAMKILKDVEEAGPKLRNPTAYVLKAFDNTFHEGSQMDAAVDVSKISRTVGWLNKHVPLVEKLSFNDVVGPLSALDQATAMKILHDLQDKHETVKNPTGYVLKAASNADHRQVGYTMPPQAAPAARGGGWAVDHRQLDPTGKIGRQVGWLNKNIELVQPVSFNDVVEPLSALEVHEAMKILKELEEKAETIKNPTAYVARAAINAAGSDASPRMQVSSSMAGPRGGSAVGDSRGQISRKVGWLNKSKVLQEPVSFSDVIDPLSALDIDSAMKILTDLEDRAEHIQKPTAYIIKAARNANGRSPATKRKWLPSSAGPADGPADDSKRISQKVGYLNKIAKWPAKLSYSDVKDPLEKCGVKIALEILEDLEHADDVKDPTDHVLRVARRSISGGEGDGQEKRRRH